MAKVKLLASLALVLRFFSVNACIKVPPSPITCINSFTTLENFVDCLNKYTVPSDFYDAPCYNSAQPSASEIVAWKNVIQKILTFGCPPGSPGAVPVPGLLSDYTITRVTEPGYAWCILSEANTYADHRVYRRGWGFVVTPADPVNGVVRDLHFSVPHPISDENTPQQAAVLFKKTGAKSLVVTGRHRKAYAIPSTCVVPTPPDVYYKTDAAHDDNEPFYLALKQVVAWKDQNGGCKWSCCAYLQIHGMAKDTCPDYVFMSRNQLVASFGPPIGIPSVPASCGLTATRNIFGRLVSGISAAAVCGSTPSIPCITVGSTCPPGGCIGKFVHIEQDPDFRLGTNYGRWITAINSAFPPRAQCPTNVLEENAFKVQS